MPLQKLQYRPGVNKEGTNYANEGGFFECDKVRFRSGYPEKIGGWASLSTYTFKGVGRALWNWITLAGANLCALGTNQKLYVEDGGQYNDITPVRQTTTTLGAPTGPFTTTNGSPYVLVAHSGHGATVNSFVSFSGAAAVGGLTISGEYEIVQVPDGNSYYIIASANASSSTTGGGATVTATYYLNAGLATYTTGNGWGAGVWSRGTWGSATTVGVGNQLTLWSVDNYGQDLVACQRGGTIYYWVVDTSTYARAVTLSSLSTTAGYDGTRVPSATFQILTSDIQRFAICFGANPYDPATANTTFDPMLVRWSDQENIYQWVPAVTNQAGEQRLSHGSSIVAARHVRQETLIWTDSGLYAMQYLGPPYVFGFTAMADNISITSPNCVATANNITYWMGIDKFYVYSGRVETLPCSLRQYVFNDINKDQAYQIVCGTNEGYNEVWWHYPSANSMVNDRYVIFNYLERVWYYGTLNRTAWLDSALRQYPMAAYSAQNTYLTAAVNSSATQLDVFNASSYPATGTLLVDSEKITYTSRDSTSFYGCVRGVGGTTAASHAAYAAVTNVIANQILYHEYGVDDASTTTPTAIAAYIQSSDFDIGDGHNFGFVWRMIPDLTFSGSTAASPSVTLTIKPRQYSGSNYGTADSPTVTRTATYPVEQYTGQVYTRLRGRQMAFRIDSTDLGVTWQLGVPRIDIRQDGRR
jgi:hypothetical protein